jgi:hypothetical protein
MRMSLAIVNHKGNAHHEPKYMYINKVKEGKGREGKGRNPIFIESFSKRILQHNEYFATKKNHCGWHVLHPM